LVEFQVKVELWPLSIAAGDADSVIVGAAGGGGGGGSVFATTGGGATFFAQPVPVKTIAAKHSVTKTSMPVNLFIAFASFHPNLAEFSVIE